MIPDSSHYATAFHRKCVAEKPAHYDFPVNHQSGNIIIIPE
jgi:hypothetical protein